MVGVCIVVDESDFEDVLMRVETDIAGEKIGAGVKQLGPQSGLCWMMGCTSRGSHIKAIAKILTLTQIGATRRLPGPLSSNVNFTLLRCIQEFKLEFTFYPSPKFFDYSSAHSFYNLIFRFDSVIGQYTHSLK